MTTLPTKAGKALQYFGQAPAVLAGADQADEDLVENRGLGGHGLREFESALDGFDQASDDFAEARVFDGVAQVGEAV